MRWTTSDDPWRELRAAQRQMDDVFRSLFSAPGRNGTRLSHRTGPGFNVSERSDAYVVEAALPGLSRDDVRIEATSNSLTIKGERKTGVPEGYTVHRRERGDLELSRTFTFDSKLDLERVGARMKNGLLTVEVGKHPEEQPRSISIQAK
jgi:HSP20 family protein